MQDGRTPTGTEKQRTWWILNLTGVFFLFFILLQSACTAVRAISGVRVVIGLTALAAASGLHRPASGFHPDAIRIPLMSRSVRVGRALSIPLRQTSPA